MICGSIFNLRWTHNSQRFFTNYEYLDLFAANIIQEHFVVCYNLFSEREEQGGLCGWQNLNANPKFTLDNFKAEYRFCKSPYLS